MLNRFRPAFAIIFVEINNKKILNKLDCFNSLLFAAFQSISNRP